MLRHLAVIAGFLAVMTPAVPAENLLEAPPGRLYDIGELRLHMNCLGSGRPLVIFDAGLGGFSLEWLGVQRALADEMTACAYDRAGYGWSETGPSPRTTSQIHDEFVRLLETAALEPPYILVGHSFGGYNVQYFAKTYPDKVAGIILLDSSHPDQADRIPEMAVRQRHVGRPRLVTFFNDPSVLNKYPEDVRDEAAVLITGRRAIVTQQRELSNFTYSGSEVRFLSLDFPEVPLVVVTRGQRVWPDDPLGRAREQAWQKMQQELAALNGSGRQVIATESGHMIHLDQPALVANIIRQMARSYCGEQVAAAPVC